MAKRLPTVDLVDALIVLGACRGAVQAVRAWSRGQRPKTRRATALLAYANRQQAHRWRNWIYWLRGWYGLDQDVLLIEALRTGGEPAALNKLSYGAAARSAAQARLRAAARARGITW